MLVQKRLVALHGELVGLVVERLLALAPELLGRDDRLLAGAAERGGRQTDDRQPEPDEMAALHAGATVEEAPLAVNSKRRSRPSGRGGGPQSRGRRASRRVPAQTPSRCPRRGS